MTELKDNFLRQIKYLRVSITDLCNLNCRYCNPINSSNKLKHQEILRFEEILYFIKTAKNLGIDKVRISGGEPFFRKNIDYFLKELGTVDLKKKAITTNGILLDKHLLTLIDNGFTSINISLDTLNKKKFEFITGKNLFNRVWQNILKALESGIKVKINSVIMGGINDDEIEALALLSKKYPLDVRFIELMPFKTNIGITPYPADFIFKKLAKIGEYSKVKRSETDGPASKIKFKDFKGETGVIAALSNHFCNNCNRIRLSSDGMIIPCLLSSKRIKIKDVLRSSNEPGNEKLIELIQKAVKEKPLGHNLRLNSKNYVKSAMIKIGG